ncbi:MAG: aldo/keto reductase, partial [Pseudolabrys sp.]
MNTGLTRRELVALAGASLVAPSALAQTEPLLMRSIPSSGERVPAVGLGTARIFDRDDETTRGKAAAVIQALVANGGRIVDTASTYGDAELVVGVEMANAAMRDKIFIATKLESPDAAELKRSLTRLKTTKVDLLQL